MTIYLIKLILIVVFNIGVNTYYINSGCNCCCCKSKQVDTGSGGGKSNSDILPGGGGLEGGDLGGNKQKQEEERGEAGDKKEKEKEEEKKEEPKKEEVEKEENIKDEEKEEPKKEEPNKEEPKAEEKKEATKKEEHKKKEGKENIESSKKECELSLNSVLNENKDFLDYLGTPQSINDGVHTVEINRNNEAFLKFINGLKEEISKEIKNVKSQDKIKDINKSIQNLKQTFKIKLMSRINSFCNGLDAIYINRLSNKNQEIVKKIVEIDYKSEDINEKKKKQTVAKENDAKELFILYQEILNLNKQWQIDKLKNNERQQKEKYNEETNRLNYLKEMLNDLNNKILKYNHPNDNEHYMTTANKNIYPKLNKIREEYTDLLKTCKGKKIDIKNIPKYTDAMSTNETALNNLKKIEEKYFNDKKEYLKEDKSRRSEIFKRENNLTKYKKTTTTNVERSTYVKDLYNVPFLSEYNGFGAVFIPFAFELDKGYKEIFPEEMIEEVEKKLNEHEMDSNKNFHIYFCYQYIHNLSEKKNAQLLFRPHYFIAKQEINKKYNSLLKEGKSASKKENYTKCTTYNEIQGPNEHRNNNTCIFYDSKHCIINEVIDNFSVHDGDLSFKEPMVDLIPANENQIQKTYVYYSFVLEHDKKIAALTIHFLCFPIETKRWDYIFDAIAKGDKFYKNNNTIESAINFAKNNEDEEVVEFLNQITK